MALADINLTPTKAMVKEAQNGLKLRKEYKRGGTNVGVNTANKIINNELTISLVKKMYAYHERHEVDSQAKGYRKGEEGYPSAGLIASKLWGHDAGQKWSTRKRNEIIKEEQRSLKNNPIIIKMEKEIKNIKKEIRIFDCMELKAFQQDDATVLKGYASVFNSLSHDLGGYREIINERSFDNVIDKDNVFALYNHNTDQVLASTESKTLKLKIDKRGLQTEIKLPDTQLGRDLSHLVGKNILNQMSFGFTIKKDSWQNKDGEYIRTVDEIDRLFEISIVPMGAYPQTEIGKRSLEQYKKTEQTKINIYKNKLTILKLK
jgi:HK97 family phage prohead protease